MYRLRGLSLQRFEHFRETNYHDFWILLSKIAEIHVWNKLKAYKRPRIQRNFYS